MENLLVPIPVLALLFACVAFFYASVGLGGGSSYTALLAIFGASTAAIPMVSLTLYVLATSFGSLVFLLHGHARLKLIGPFIITSVPMTFIWGNVESAYTDFLYTAVNFTVLCGCPDLFPQQQ